MNQFNFIFKGNIFFGDELLKFEKNVRHFLMQVWYRAEMCHGPCQRESRKILKVFSAA